MSDGENLTGITGWLLPPWWCANTHHLCCFTVTDNMTENEEIFKEEIHTLLNTAERDWFVNPKDKWTFFGSLFFCCTVFTTVGKFRVKATPSRIN